MCVKLLNSLKKINIYALLIKSHCQIDFPSGSDASKTASGMRTNQLIGPWDHVHKISTGYGAV